MHPTGNLVADTIWALRDSQCVDPVAELPGVDQRTVNREEPPIWGLPPATPPRSVPAPPLPRNTKNRRSQTLSSL